MNNTAPKLQKQNFFMKLISTDTHVSSKSFFLVATTIVGIILLFVPAIVLLVEVYYNHTVTTDLNGIAAYIGAVAAIFASSGITKAWSEYSENKFGRHGQSNKNHNEETTSDQQDI